MQEECNVNHSATCNPTGTHGKCFFLIFFDPILVRMCHDTYRWQNNRINYSDEGSVSVSKGKLQSDSYDWFIEFALKNPIIFHCERKSRVTQLGYLAHCKMWKFVTSLKYFIYNLISSETAEVRWPSGLRRGVKAAISSEA